jgi:hypothetical protein
MNIPIKMIGIATTIFWVFLIAFSVSAAFSAKDIQFNFGDPQTGMTATNEPFFSLPITVANRGFYNIGNFNVTSLASDADGNEIARANTFVPEIRAHEEVTVFHNVTLDIDKLMQGHQNYLFNDTDLRIREVVGLSLASIIPVQASGNFTLPWGAPLFNFVLGNPTYSPYNATHFRATVPISFENHAFFDLAGSLRISMYNDLSVRIGDGQTTIDVPQHTGYYGNIELYVSTADAINPGTSPRGHFDVNLFSPLFNYGPWVIPYG